MSDYVIEAVNLSKHFGEVAVVKGIDFKMPRGVCFGILGPNGAGKTTTIRMIMGLSPLGAGSLKVLGHTMPDEGELVRAKLGVVSQADALDPDFTVLENLLVYASYFDIAKDVARPRAESLLAMMELTERVHHKPATLSGGMLRRLSIARALMNDPELIILDEPTTGLDPQVRHLIWNLMRGFLKEGKSILLTTHYMEEAERLCDDLLIMDSGDIIEQGSPASIISQRVEPEVLEIKLDETTCRTLLKDVEDLRFEAVGDHTYCYTRDAQSVVTCLQGLSNVSYLHRPANLEDVFLAMTGRELKD